MTFAGQRVPLTPTTELTPEERKLRASLMLEEVLETANALGVRISFWGSPINRGYVGDEKTNPSLGPAINPREFEIVGPLDIVEVVDGCCDVEVVTKGTLTAIGVSDVGPQDAVNEANMKKFGPGGHKHPVTGKWIKPADWQPPDLLAILIAQGFTPPAALGEKS